MTYKRSALMQQRLDQNREAILSAARKLIAQGGIKDTQIQAIAQLAGVSNGSVYRYFKDKNHLIIEVLSEAIQGELTVLTNIAQAEMPARDKLYKAVKTFVKRALNSSQLAYSLMLEPAGEKMEEARFESKQLIRQAIEQILQEGKQQAVFDFDEIGATALCIVGAMTFAVIEPFSLNPDTINKNEFAHKVADFCVKAVLKESNQPV